MNLVNEIGNDVARAFLIDKKCADRIDVLRAREIINAIRSTLKERKVVPARHADGTKTLVAKTAQ